jgi:hypothetical protein
MEFPWNSMELYGISMEFYGTLWNFHGTLWNSMEFYVALTD